MSDKITTQAWGLAYNVCVDTKCMSYVRFYYLINVYIVLLCSDEPQ